MAHRAPPQLLSAGTSARRVLPDFLIWPPTCGKQPATHSQRFQHVHRTEPLICSPPDRQDLEGGIIDLFHQDRLTKTCYRQPQLEAISELWWHCGSVWTARRAHCLPLVAWPNVVTFYGILRARAHDWRICVRAAHDGGRRKRLRTNQPMLYSYGHPERLKFGENLKGHPFRAHVAVAFASRPTSLLPKSARPSRSWPKPGPGIYPVATANQLHYGVVRKHRRRGISEKSSTRSGVVYLGQGRVSFLGSTNYVWIELMPKRRRSRTTTLR